MGEMVSLRFCLYVLDFVVDDLVQSTHLGADIKGKVRAFQERIGHLS